MLTKKQHCGSSSVLFLLIFLLSLLPSISTLILSKIARCHVIIFDVTFGFFLIVFFIFLKYFFILFFNIGLIED
jgi:hypothetical protein